MERTKKIQELINRVPEAGTTLIDLWKWIIRNHFTDTTIYPDPLQEKIIIQCKYTEQRYEKVVLYLYIFMKEDSWPNAFWSSIRNIERYLKYERKHETAPITFEEYSDIIEKQYFKYLVLLISDREHGEDIVIDF